MTETNLVAPSNAIIPDHDDWQIGETARLARSNLGLLSEEEVAAMLGLRSVSTLATWRSLGQGPRFVKLGKKVFYTVNFLGTWINNVSVAQSDARAIAAGGVVQAPQLANAA